MELQGRLKGSTRVVLTAQGSGTPDPEDASQASLWLYRDVYLQACLPGFGCRSQGLCNVWCWFDHSETAACGAANQSTSSAQLHCVLMPCPPPQLVFSFTTGFVPGKEYEFRARARNAVVSWAGRV